MAIMEITLNVEGMSCNHCKAAVEKALRNIEGVQQVTVDLAGKKVVVSFDTGKVNEAQIAAAIDEAGYQVV